MGRILPCINHRPVFGQIQWMGKRRQFSPKLLRHAHVLDIKLLISCRYSINIWYIYIMYMYTYIYTHMYIYMSICEKNTWTACSLRRLKTTVFFAPVFFTQGTGRSHPIIVRWHTDSIILWTRGGQQDAGAAIFEVSGCWRSYGNHGTKKRHIIYFYGSSIS